MAFFLRFARRACTRPPRGGRIGSPARLVWPESSDNPFPLIGYAHHDDSRVHSVRLRFFTASVRLRLTEDFLAGIFPGALDRAIDNASQGRNKYQPREPR